MKVYDNVCDLIGNTPLVRLNNIEEYLQINNRIYAKIEKFNPGGSSKDRPAYQIIKEAIEKEKIEVYENRNRTCVTRSILIRESLLKGLSELKIKYGLSISMLVNIAVKNEIMEEQK